MRGGRGGDWETTVKRSILTPEGLRRLIDRYDRLEYKIMLDASFSRRFIDALKSSPRVRIIETSSAAAEVSFGHIRDGEVSDANGKEIRNPTRNPGPRRRVHQRQRTRPRDLGGHPDPHGRTLWEGLNAAFDLGAGQDFARSLGLTNPQRHFSRPVTPPALEAPPAPPPPSPPAQDPVTTRFSFYPGDPTNEIDFLPPQQFPQCGVQGNELSCSAAPG